MASISDKHDAALRALYAGTLKPGSDTTFLNSIKTYLDANYAQFKDPATGDYTWPHVKAAALQVRSRGT